MSACVLDAKRASLGPYSHIGDPISILPQSIDEEDLQYFHQYDDHRKPGSNERSLSRQQRQENSSNSSSRNSSRNSSQPDDDDDDDDDDGDHSSPLKVVASREPPEPDPAAAASAEKEEENRDLPSPLDDHELDLTPRLLAPAVKRCRRSAPHVASWTVRRANDNVTRSIDDDDNDVAGGPGDEHVVAIYEQPSLERRLSAQLGRRVLPESSSHWAVQPSTRLPTTSTFKPDVRLHRGHFHRRSSSGAGGGGGGGGGLTCSRYMSGGGGVERRQRNFDRDNMAGPGAATTNEHQAAAAAAACRSNSFALDVEKSETLTSKKAEAEQLELPLSPAAYLHICNSKSAHHKQDKNGRRRRRDIEGSSSSKAARGGASRNGGGGHRQIGKMRAPFLFAGILGSILGSLFFSLSMLTIKLLPDGSGLAEKTKIVAFRGLSLMIFCAGTILYQKSSFKVPREELLINVIRSLLGFTGVFGSYISLKYISMGDSTALVFSSPVWTSLLSHFILNEPLQWIQLLALPLSILGIVLIAHPSLVVNMDMQNMVMITAGASFSGERQSTAAALIEDPNGAATSGLAASAASLDTPTTTTIDAAESVLLLDHEHRWKGIAIALATSIIVSFVYIVLKFRKVTPIQTTTFWLGFTTCAGALALGCFIGFGKWPSGALEWSLIVFNGICSWLGQCLLQWGLKYEDASVLSVVRTLDVAMTFTLSALFLDEQILWTSVLGASIIAAVVISIMLNNYISSRLCPQALDSDNDNTSLSPSVTLSTGEGSGELELGSPASAGGGGGDKQPETCILDSKAKKAVELASVAA